MADKKHFQNRHLHLFGGGGGEEGEDGACDGGRGCA